MDAELWNLPQPEQSEIVWKDKPVEIMGIMASATHLRCYGLKEQIQNFYKDVLNKENWQVNADFTNERILAFNKGEKFIYVMAADTGNPQNQSCEVFLVSSPSSLAVCNILKEYFFKKEVGPDAPGKDFSDIPRYPGSKRRLNVFVPGQVNTLMYETDAKPREIADFYQQVLKAGGWKEEGGSNEEIVGALAKSLRNLPKSSVAQFKENFSMLCFYKGEDSLLIHITVAPKDVLARERVSNRSMIMITKNVEGELAGFEKGEE